MDKNDSRALVRNQLQAFQNGITRLEEERVRHVARLLDDHLLPASGTVCHELSAKVNTEFDALFDTALDKITAEYESSSGTMDEIRQAVEENAGYWKELDDRS